MQAGAWSRRDPRTSDLHIYGPAGVHDLLNYFMDAFRPTSFTQPTYRIEVHEIREGSYTIAGKPVEFMSLPPAGNHGLRFEWNGKRYAITGDSSFHEQEIAFLRDVDLAIIDSGHPEDSEIVELAAATQARHIVCSHLYREIDAAKLQKLAMQKGYTGEISVGYDLRSFTL
jgi:ribonuclease BN (tRNA processing enzyme)